MRALILAVAGLLSPGLAAAHAGHDSKPLEHFGWLKDLAGACWKGEHPDGRTRDTQCFQIQFDRFLRSTIQLSELRSGQWEPSFQGESVLAWDDANQRISYWYWTTSGAFGPAEAYVDSEQIHFPASRKPTPTGALEVRSTWTRIDASSYRVSRQKRDGGGAWKEIFTVVYRRVPG